MKCSFKPDAQCQVYGQRCHQCHIPPQFGYQWDKEKKCWYKPAPIQKPWEKKDSARPWEEKDPVD